MTHLRRTMRQKAFFRQMDIIPPSPSRHAHRPLCHARRPLCHARRPLRHARRPLCHARSTPLSFPQFLAGIQSKQSCSKAQSGGIPLGKASTAEW